MTFGWAALLAIQVLSARPDPVRRADLRDLWDYASDPALDAADAAWLEGERGRSEQFLLSPEPPPPVSPEPLRRALQARLTYRQHWNGPTGERWVFLAEVAIGLGAWSRIGRAVPYRPPRVESLRRRRCERLDDPADPGVRVWLRAARFRVLGCGGTAP